MIRVSMMCNNATLLSPWHQPFDIKIGNAKSISLGQLQERKAKLIRSKSESSMPLSSLRDAILKEKKEYYFTPNLKTIQFFCNTKENKLLGFGD